MAQHQVKVYAVDSYTQDWKSGEVTRANPVTGQEVFIAYEDATYDSSTEKMLVVVFPDGIPDGYTKKNFSGLSHWIYVTQKSASLTGDFYTGPAYGVEIYLSAPGVAYKNAGAVFRDDAEWAHFPLNQYSGQNYSGTLYTAGVDEKMFVVPTADAGIDSGTARGNLSISVQAHNGENPPYRIYTFDDIPVEVYGAIPTGGYVNVNDGTGEISFQCSMRKVDSYMNSVDPLYLAAVKFRWRETGSEQYQETDYTAPGNSNYFQWSVPKSTFPSKSSFQWQALVQSNDGIWSDPTPWYTISTTDSIGTATPVSPINEYVDGTEPVSLVWDWNISTGTAATKADFQTSNNSGSSWTALGSVEGEVPYVAAPGTLPDGNVLWQVRGYNSDGVAGPWSSSANIVVRQAPAAPILESATPVPKPTVTWQSAGQQAYQLQAGDWDSGPVFGTAKSAQVEEFLPAGQTAIRLRVQNSFGLWSPWAEMTVTIVNTPGEAITAEAQPVQGGVQISWATEGEYPAYYVYRDGDLIGVTESQPFADYRAIGEHEYFVRGVNADSTYTQSNTVSAATSPRWGMIAVDGEWNWLELRYMRGSFVTLSDNRQANVSYAYYSGRSLPVAEVSGTRSRQISVTYSLKKPDLEALYGMLGQLVVYKDRRTLCMGILDSVATTADWCSDVSITITEVDDGT